VMRGRAPRPAAVVPALARPAVRPAGAPLPRTVPHPARQAVSARSAMTARSAPTAARPPCLPLLGEII
jgi:hypothetical protein